MNQNQYFTLSNDIIFKNAFNDDESLKRLLKETLGVKVENIIKNNIELSVDNKTERRKYLDLILKTDKGVYNVELNYGYKEELPNRNLSYFCKLFSSSVKKNKSYTNVDRHIQLNITWNLSRYLNYDVKNRKIIKYHISDDETHNKIYEDIFEIVHINMDYFKGVWYDGNVEKENPFLMLLAASDEAEMDRISEGDKLMEEVNKKVKKLNQDPEVLDVIIENEDEIIANSMYEKGIERGIEQGIEKKSMEIVKNLLNMNMPVDKVAKATGLSIDEIQILSDK